MNERYDRTTRDYLKASALLVSVAERKLKTKLPDEDAAGFASVSMVLRLADCKLDAESDFEARKALVSASVGYLSGKNGFDEFGDESYCESLEKLNEFLEGKGEEIRAAFVRNLKILCRITEILKHERDIEKYIFLTKLEGQVTSKLLSVLLPGQGNRRLSLVVDAYKHLGRGGNLLDSLMDMDTDFRNREILVDPSFKNRAKMVLSLLPDSTTVVSSSSRKRLDEFGTVDFARFNQWFWQ